MNLPNPQNPREVAQKCTECTYGRQELTGNIRIAGRGRRQYPRAEVVCVNCYERHQLRTAHVIAQWVHLFGPVPMTQEMEIPEAAAS